MNKNTMLISVLLPLTAVAAGTGAAATDRIIIPGNTSPRLQVDLKTLKPYQNPLLAPDTSAVRPSSEPTLRVPGAKGMKVSKTSQRAFGSFGVPYTSKRVSHRPTSAVSSNSNAYLSATYPYRAIGRLTFNSGSLCTASLIRKSVIVTAAHCVQEFGSGDNVFSNFQFTPASYNGSAPYGSWSVGAIVRSGSWADGTDIGSNAARDNDLAVMIINKNAQGQFIGNITGYLTYGWNNYSFVSHNLTGDLWTAALTTLGYPGLLDAGRIMQRTDGSGYLTTIDGAGQIYQGSNLTGGSSGGPWIANFGYQDPTYSGGANGGDSFASNVVVGVTSWGASDPNDPKNNYASQFRQNSRYPDASYGTFGAGNIGSLLNTLCTSQPFDGGQTYQQLGYCN